MSLHAIQAVKLYSESTDAAYIVLLMIADGIDSKVDVMRGHSVRELAEYAHFCPWNATKAERAGAQRRCYRMLDQLIAAGELIVFSGGGAWRNTYSIPIFSGETGYAPESCPEFLAPAEEKQHWCNGFHTPLDVSRERLALDERNERKRAALGLESLANPVQKRRARVINRNVDK